MVPRPPPRWTVASVVALVAVCVGIVTATAAGGYAVDSEPITESVGGETWLSLSVPSGEPATVVIRDENGTLRREISVLETTQDGSIALHLHLGSGRLHTDDDVLRDSGLAGTTGVEAGTYEVALFRGRDPGDSPADAVSLAVKRHPEATLTIYTAPRAATDRLRDRESVRKGLSNGWLTRDSALSLTDALVVRLRTPNASWAFPTGAVLESGGTLMPDPGDLDAPLFRGVQTNPNLEREPLLFDADGVAVDRVIADPANHTYWVVTDPTTIGVEYGNVVVDARSRDSLRSGMKSALFVDPYGSPTVSETNATVVFQGERVTFGPTVDDRRIPFAPAENLTLVGLTTVAPGTQLDVTLSGPGGSGFERTRRVTVRQDPAPLGEEWDAPIGHAFSFGVDLGKLPSGANVTIKVAANGTVVSREKATIRATNASVRLAPNQTWPGGQVRVESATLPEGGFVVLRAGLGKPIAGNSTYLSPGTYTDLFLALREDWQDDRSNNRALDPPAAVLYRDIDGDRELTYRDDQYVRNGFPVSTGSAWNVTSETSPAGRSQTTESPARTTDAHTTVDTMPVETTEREPSGDGDERTTDRGIGTRETTSGAGPGFEAIAGVCALAATIALAVLRRSRAA